MGTESTDSHRLFVLSKSFSAGDHVQYTGSDGVTQSARVLCVHRDDEEPYYTIALSSGVEKNTDGNHLRKSRSVRVIPMQVGVKPTHIYLATIRSRLSSLKVLPKKYSNDPPSSHSLDVSIWPCKSWLVRHGGGTKLEPSVAGYQGHPIGE